MGFWELIVIVIVGIIVLGPEKLPSAMRKFVLYKRQLNQTFQSLSADVNEQLRIQELHNHLKQAEQQNFENLSDEVKASVEELKQAANSVSPPPENALSKQNHDK